MLGARTVKQERRVRGTRFVPQLPPAQKVDHGAVVVATHVQLKAVAHHAAPRAALRRRRQQLARHPHVPHPALLAQQHVAQEHARVHVAEAVGGGDEELPRPRQVGLHGAAAAVEVAHRLVEQPVRVGALLRRAVEQLARRRGVGRQTAVALHVRQAQAVQRARVVLGGGQPEVREPRRRVLRHAFALAQQVAGGELGVSQPRRRGALEPTEGLRLVARHAVVAPVVQVGDLHHGGDVAVFGLHQHGLDQHVVLALLPCVSCFHDTVPAGVRVQQRVSHLTRQRSPQPSVVQHHTTGKQAKTKTNKKLTNKQKPHPRTGGDGVFVFLRQPVHLVVRLLPRAFMLPHGLHRGVLRVERRR